MGIIWVMRAVLFDMLYVFPAKIVQTEGNDQRKAKGFYLALLRCSLSRAKIQQKTENEGRMMKNL